MPSLRSAIDAQLVSGGTECRYTEWVKWDGTKLLPVWDELIGRELYSHIGDDGTDFDGFENVNEIETAPRAVVSGLQATLHAVVANQTRLSSFLDRSD